MERRQDKRQRDPFRPPGRFYTAVTTALATLLIGLGTDALIAFCQQRQLPPTRAVSLDISLSDPPTATRPISSINAQRRPSDPFFPQQRLKRLAAIALGVGLAVQLVPRRRALTQITKPATSLRDLTGFPILGVLFPKPESSLEPPAARSRCSRFLGQIVLLAETILCIAVLIAVYASIRERTIAQRFIEQPFEAFGQAIQYVAASIVELLANGPHTR